MGTITYRQKRAERSCVFVILAIVAGVAGSFLGSQALAEVRQAPDPVTDSYIVILKDVSRAEVPEVARRLAGQHEGRLGFVYTEALRGFSVRMPERQAAALSRHPKVALVEQDGRVRASATQSGPPAGLDRIDRPDLPLNSLYDYKATGFGVRAYVIDSGIVPTHSEFGGRASVGYDAMGDGRKGIDCNGHGTHVAGTVGGSTYGVAKAVSLVGVRVLDCNGYGAWSGVIAGVDWVTRTRVLPAVANMSLGGGASSSVDQAVANSIASGVNYSIAAGNGNLWGQAEDACNASPARVPAAMTISATDSSDKKASWANYGKCVDLFSPGVGIKSAWHSSDTATSTMSGTSMAAPHAAGVAAQFLQSNTTASPGTVASAISSAATSGKVQSAGTGSPDKLLYSNFVSDPGNTPPFARYSFSCSGLSCDFSDRSYDSDGTITARNWDFGDSSAGSGASVTHAFSKAGTYNVKLTVIDDGAVPASSSQTQAVSVTSSEPAPSPSPSPAGSDLESGKAVSAVSGAQGTWQYYKMGVPSGKTTLRADLTGNTPNLDVFVMKGQKPTASLFYCQGAGPTSNDSCSTPYPGADTWYVGVRVTSGSNLSYTVKATLS